MMSKNDACCYIVYWYPTIFHREKQRQEEFSKEFVDISDSSNLPLSIKKEEQGKDLLYTLLFKDINHKISLRFEFVDDRKNGFSIYKYNRETLRGDLRKALKEALQKAIKNALENGTEIKDEYIESALDKYDSSVIDKYIDEIFISCYHNAKDLYHKHEIQDSSDGRLEAYFKNSETGEYLYDRPDIINPNHEVISFFIEQYERLFDTYAHTISRQYSEITPKLAEYFKIASSKEIKDKKSALEYLSKLQKHVRANKLLQIALDNDKLLKTNKTNFSIEDSIDSLIGDYKQQIDDVEKELKKEQELFDAINNDENNENRKIQRFNKIKKEIWRNEDFVINFFVDYLKSLLGTCGNALTEYNYCKSLLESKYNTEYKHNLDIAENDLKILGENKSVSKELQAKDHHRKVAFNIRNSVRYIEEIRNKCTIWENEMTRNLVNSVDKMQRTSEISNRLSKHLAVWSIILGFFGILFGVLSFCNISVKKQYQESCPCIFNNQNNSGDQDAPSSTQSMGCNVDTTDSI